MDSQFVRGVLGGDITDSVSFSSVSIDSRSVKPQALFIAIIGEHFDGHDFVRAAVEKGATGVVVSRPIENIGVAQWQVDNTQAALWELAHAWRMHLSAKVIGITGSNGKSSVKEMVKHILANHRVHATAGNFNNLIGLPLTILAAPEDCEYLVLEMGMSISGEMAQLSAIAAPNIVAITNASAAHTEGVGGVDGVRREKGAIISGMVADGIVVLNRGDEGFEFWQRQAGEHRVVSFGSDRCADYRLGEDGGYYIENNEQSHVFSQELKGRHNYLNATCAVAIAREAAPLNIGQGLANLASYAPISGRLNYIVLAGNRTVIDDSYNANPASVMAGIDVLMGEPGRHYLILGDMGELGDNASLLHDEVLTYASERNVEEIYGFGAFASEAARKVGGLGYTQLNELISALLAAIKANAVVLIKGSRSMRMERVVAALCDSYTPEQRPC